MSEDWLLCFLLIGQLKVCFHFRIPGPLQKIISRAKLFALRCLPARNSLSTLEKSGGGRASERASERARGGNISSRFIERSINRSLLPLTPLTPADPRTSCYQPGKLDFKADSAPAKGNNSFRLRGLCVLVWICASSVFFPRYLGPKTTHPALKWQMVYLSN